jgi:hypothetical protein
MNADQRDLKTKSYRRESAFICGSKRFDEQRRTAVDNISLIRIIAAVGFGVVLLVLIQRRRKRVH